MEPVIGTFLTDTCQESARTLGGDHPYCRPNAIFSFCLRTRTMLHKDPKEEGRTHLALHIDTVLVEHRIDLCILQGTKQQGLAIVLGPIIEAPHPHSRKVHPMWVQGQQIHVVHQMLWAEKTLPLGYWALLSILGVYHLYNPLESVLSSPKLQGSDWWLTCPYSGEHAQQDKLKPPISWIFPKR